VASVRAVFSWSLDHLAAPAARIFGLLGLHPGPDITIPAAASLAGIAPRRAREALRELAGAHLVNEHAPGRFSLHDLMRVYAAEQAAGQEAEPERHVAVQRMLDHYLHTAHAADRLLKPTRSPIALDPPQPGTAPEVLSGRTQAMAWLLAEQQVLFGVAEYAHAVGCTAHAWKLPWTMSAFLDFRGDWQQMATVHHMALAAACGADDKGGQAHAHVNLAHACMRLGRTHDGFGHLEHALALYREMGSPAGQGRTHLALALALDTEGRYDEAFSHNRQALCLLDQAGDHAGRADALSSVGWSHALRGNYAEALACCLRAVELQRESGNRYGEAHTLDSIGYVHRHLGQHVEAVTCYEQSASLFSELGDRYYEADALINLGDTFGASGGPQMARDAWQKALNILDNLHHPRAAQVRERLRLTVITRRGRPEAMAPRGDDQ
jgi:tetratricopeptide (TPR) repeat protein